MISASLLAVSQVELSCCVVGPGFVDADVAADGGQGSVVGLLGHGPVGGSAWWALVTNPPRRLCEL